MNHTHDKYLLVRLDDFGENGDASWKKKRNLRRYLRSHGIDFEVFKTSASLVDSVTNNFDYDFTNLLRQIQESEHQLDPDVDPIIKVGTNQEMLENWARETFAEGSEELHLIIDVHPIDPSRETQAESNNNNNNEIEEVEEKVASSKPSPDRKRFSSFHIDEIFKDDPKMQKLPSSGSSSSMSSHESVLETLFAKDNSHFPKSDHEREDHESPLNSDDSGDENFEAEAKQLCSLCNNYMIVGKTKTTKLRRQSAHVLHIHRALKFGNLCIQRRYQCNVCQRIIPVHVSPCHHISNFHDHDGKECTFTDLWSREEHDAFDDKLLECFNRRLPVPRARRDKKAFVSSRKASYKIRTGNEITELKTIEEKPSLEESLLHVPSTSTPSGQQTNEDGAQKDERAIDDTQYYYVDSMISEDGVDDI